MKQFTKKDKLVHVSDSGMEVVEYVGYHEGRGHLVKWTIGKNTFSGYAKDESLFRVNRCGLRSAFDAEVERRHEAAKADMKGGNPTATHLVHTLEILAA